MRTLRTVLLFAGYLMALLALGWLIHANDASDEFDKVAGIIVLIFFVLSGIAMALLYDHFERRK